MTVRPRLGYLVPRFPGPTHPAFWREVRALEAQGVEVVLLSDRPPAPGSLVHPWSAEAMARTSYLTGRGPGGLRALPSLPWREIRSAEPGLRRDLLAALGPARALLRAAERHGLRHIHVHGTGRPALAAVLSERMGGPSYSLTLHRPLSEDGPGQNVKWRAARFATVATQRLLAEVKTVLREDCPARVVVQPMGVDTEALRRDIPYVPRAAEEEFRIFACGRLEPARGLMDILGALRRLLDRRIQARLRIAGEEAPGHRGYRAALEARAHELRLGNRAAFLGPIGDDRVREELMAAQAFALPAHHEPLGVALVEAMACGLPVVATAAGGVRELVTHGVDGLLVPPRDIQALAGALEQVARRPALAIALSLAARDRVEHGFDASRNAQALMRELELRPWDEIRDDLPALPLRAG
jgi:glycosyltransferase involved in cell wall biosynthesis